jgi:hypothetical protein
MKTQFCHNCPHCRTKGAGFSIRFQWQERDTRNAQFLAVCGVCNRGITVHSQALNSQHIDLIANRVEYPGNNYIISAVWPSFKSDIPDGVPENIGGFYDQGLRNLYEKRWDAAGAMFRKTLDIATKILDPQNSKDTLFARINKLVESGTLTQSMGDWSHEIRIDGNDAVHDEEPETLDDATSAQKFTEAFLIYAFSLPKMVEINRQKRSTE